jgi:hypothetical protein
LKSVELRIFALTTRSVAVPVFLIVSKVEHRRRELDAPVR